MTAMITFEESMGENRALPLLDYCLNESQGYMNVVAATSRLDSEFCEQVVKAIHAGHYIAVLYFAPPKFDHESEKMYELLYEGGFMVYRITDKTRLNETAA
jgi:hypothetical protein